MKYIIIFLIKKINNYVFVWYTFLYTKKFDEKARLNIESTTGSPEYNNYTVNKILYWNPTSNKYNNFVIYLTNFIFNNLKSFKWNF